MTHSIMLKTLQLLAETPSQFMVVEILHTPALIIPYNISIYK
jgi:hypothetical protein